MRKQYNSIDLFKFLSCLLVVVIHTTPFSFNFYLDAVIGVLTRFAIPFFFGASSFLLSKKLSYATNEERNAILIKYIKRIMQIYIIWTVLYLPLSIKFWLRDGVLTSGEIFSHLSSIILRGDFYYLWFLHALIIATALYYVLFNKMSHKQIVSISAILFIVGLIFSTYANFFNQYSWWQFLNKNLIIYVGVQNGFFYGLPYIIIGDYIANHEGKHTFNFYACFTMISFVLLTIESAFAVFVLKTSLTFLWISALPLGYFGLRAVLSFQLPDNKIFIILRKMTILIYVSESYFVTLFKKIFSVTGLDAYRFSNIILFFVVTASLILFSYSIVYLSKKVKVFKYLY